MYKHFLFFVMFHSIITNYVCTNLGDYVHPWVLSAVTTHVWRSH